MKAPDLFSDADRQRIKSAIENAESMTSGEIRVYIEDECKGSVLDHTAFIFSELKMHNTALRNGVLIYLAVKDNKFAIIGDAGIHSKVGDEFWNTIKEDMVQHFKKKEFADGLVKGINDAGKALSTYFPRSLNDTNELSDDVIFGKN
jgi:uncharacterized membrane protein